MSQNKSNQNVLITIRVSREFYRILEGVAKAHETSIERYMLESTVNNLDTDLERPAGPVFGLTETSDYQPQLRDLLGGAA